MAWQTVPRVKLIEQIELALCAKAKKTAYLANAEIGGPTDPSNIEIVVSSRSTRLN